MKKIKHISPFDIINVIILGALSLAMLYPFWHELMYSLSEPSKAVGGGIFIFPRGFNLQAYISVLKNASVWKGFRVSV